MILPDFLIVGTNKSGTSSLANYLNIHPQVYMPSIEPHYFDNDNNYMKGIEWYQSFFKNGQRKKVLERGYKLYLKLFKRSKEKFILINNKKLKNYKSKLLFGEKSPTYCLSRRAARRIAFHLPDVKLIWIFRNPVDRAYSEYLYNYSHGAVRLSFEDTLKLGDKAKKYHIGIQNCNYVKIGVYSEQIKMYLKYFDKKNMIFLLFENLIENPEETLNKVFKFLKVDDKFENFNNIKVNVTTFPKNNFILWLLRLVYNKFTRLFGKPPATYYIYAITYIILEQIVIRNNLERPAMNNQTKKELIQFYEPYNKDLAELTNLNLNKWNNLE
jgi:hypothetical protein